MINKKNTFSTWRCTPIKNVKTAISRFNCCDEDDFTFNQPDANITENEYMETAVSLLNSIRILLMVLVFLIVVCLIIKK